MIRSILTTVVLFAILAHQQTSHGEVVSFRLTTTNAAGDEVHQVELGQDFVLGVWVKDVRPDPLGVVSAYVDVHYDNRFAHIQPDSLVHGQDFANIARSDVSIAGIIDEVGAFASSYRPIPPLPDPSASDEHLLFSVTLRGTSLGTAEFISDPADIMPLHATTVLGSDDAVATRDTIFGTARISIIPEPAGWLMIVLASVVVIGQKRKTGCVQV